jgi:hypothetical protein
MKFVVADLMCFASEPFRGFPPGGIARQWLEHEDTERLGRDTLQRVHRLEAQTAISLLQNTAPDTYLLTADAAYFLTTWLAFMGPETRQHLAPWSNIAKDESTPQCHWWREIGSAPQPDVQPEESDKSQKMSG